MKFLIAFLLLSLQSSYAYVNYIGHGYTSCLNCHFNPSGGGPLNDYGRVVSATLISSGSMYPKEWKEEKIAYTSGFLLRKPKQNWLRTQINYRGFQLVNNPGSSTQESKAWINMQFDGRAIIKFGEQDKFIGVFNYGYAPNPRSATVKQTEWRSREHYLGYRMTPKFGLYAGMMDKIFGLKVIEHNSYSRAVPQVAQNDQTHGVMAHYLGDKWEGFAQGFVGNLSQDENVRMKGATVMAERTIFDIHRIGASLMKSSNTVLDIVSASAHTKLNLKDGSAILGELGQSTFTSENGVGDRTSRYGLLQTYLRPVRGVYYLTNIEYYKKDLKDEAYTVRWGPALQYFPIQRVELRLDMYNTRNFSSESSNKDSWMYLFQTHLWL